MPSVREKKIKGKVQKAKGKMAAVVFPLPFAFCLLHFAFFLIFVLRLRLPSFSWTRT
jgi:hypothetical protein